ncbi:ferredoxin--NADP reductase [Pedobacter hiemivivus]|uniref:Ferredoxin--NADP reductase n=1 Tax=Pedobacter hiemivivus TaxID=2530454 RepID=A0A4R0N9K4_9SPHI|nr:ferredoxin--NADP reductase [Pedobacter hiemivivus]TCC96247.1 ferredoxin--NADP reductase [Pedobacter hiemivivus]
MVTYTLKVIEVRTETEDTITLCFKQPALRKIKYLAGQYLTLIFRINGRRYIRPYSFSSAPLVDTGLEVTIKRVPNGIVSNHIHDTITIGDSIEVMQAMGDFVCETPRAQVFLWGVGSGITPLISISKQILATSHKTQVYLIYGNRNHESTIFLDQIENLQKVYPEKFVVKHFHTKMKINQNNLGLIEGRIDQTKALNILQELGHLEDASHYICGPTGLKESVKFALKTLDVMPNQIFIEDFVLIKDPKDFEHVKTQNVKLKFEDQDYNLEVIKGKSILESALDAGIELPYSCQTGNCSTCKATIITGGSKMIGLSKERDDLLEAEYLLCCTHPLTENVYLEVN